MCMCVYVCVGMCVFASQHEQPSAAPPPSAASVQAHLQLMSSAKRTTPRSGRSAEQDERAPLGCGHSTACHYTHHSPSLYPFTNHAAALPCPPLPSPPHLA